MLTFSCLSLGVLGLGAVVGPVNSLVSPGQQDNGFSDQTQAAGVTLLHQTPVLKQPTTGIDWYRLLGALAAGDFNRDGWTDLFVGGGGLEFDHLFINQGDGTFVDQAQAWGVREKHVAGGIAVGDFDGDGWLDIFLASMGSPEAGPLIGQHKLYRNTGKTSFEDVSEQAGLRFTSTVHPDGFGATFGDYDLDGDLDLIVAGWLAGVPSDGNRLFRNESNGTFSDVTQSSGLGTLKESYGFSPWLCDMDGDFYPELLLTGDFATSRYFVNNGDGSFTDINPPFTQGGNGTGIDDNGMGSTIADFNNDGRLDWFVTSIYRSVHGFPDLGNTLYMSQGDHQFKEVGEGAGVEDSFWGWGTVSADLNNDGWIDIAANNGWGDAPNGFFEKPARIFINQANGTFSEQADALAVDYALNGRALVHLDADRDGDLDLVFYGNKAPLAYFRNEQISALAPTHASESQHNWLRVVLDTSQRPDLAPDGFGARLELFTGGRRQIRAAAYGSNYLSQSEMVQHFGLRAATKVDRLLVRWPDGSISVRKNLDANREVLVRAPILPIAKRVKY